MGISHHWYSRKARNEEGSRSCLWTNSSSDCSKEGPTLQPSHLLDAMCAEFQLIEIGNRASVGPDLHFSVDQPVLRLNWPPVME